MLSFTKLILFPFTLVLLEFTVIREITNIKFYLTDPGSFFSFLFISLTIILYKMSKDSILIFRFNRIVFLSNISLFTGYYIFLSKISKIYSPNYLNLYKTLFVIYMAIILLTLFFSFFSFKSVIKNLKRYIFEITILIIVIFPMSVFDLIRVHLWTYLAAPTTFIAYNILRIFGYNMVPVLNPFELKHALLDVLIFPPCSGLEGILIFIMVFSVLLIYEGKIYSLSRIVLGYFLGMLGMLLLNLIRIVVFVMISIWVAEKWNGAIGDKVLTNFFHNNLGWFIYLIGVLVFITIWSINKKKLTS